MQVCAPLVIGPARHQLADVDDETVRRRRDIHPFFRVVEHLQTARLVLCAQNRERSVVAVRARTQLSGLGRRRWRRIVPHPQATDMAIDLVGEERLWQIERKREYRHQVLREFAHHPEIVFVGRPQSLRFPRPEIGMKVSAGLRRREIGGVRHVDRTDHQAFIQIAWRVDALAPADALGLQWDVPPRHVGGWAKHLALFVLGQIKKGVGNALHFRHQRRIDAMTCDDKKADILDRASDLRRHGLPSLRVAFPERANVNHGNIKQHGRLRSGKHALDCTQRCRRSIAIRMGRPSASSAPLPPRSPIAADAVQRASVRTPVY